MSAAVAVFLSSFLVGLSGAMSPGPLLTTTVGESVRRGVWAGPLLMVGHAILEALLLCALLFGAVSFWEQTGDAGKAAVSFVGAAALLWLATSILFSLPQLNLTAELGKSGQGKGRLILSGALVSMSNPYWIIWWFTIGVGAMLLAQSKCGWTGIFAFYFGHIASDFFWYTLVSTAVGKGRRFLTDRMFRLVLGSCAICLGLFACFFVFEGLKFFALSTGTAA
jgi:threonine/homoserine/homoserine lactone efflux protein